MMTRQTLSAEHAVLDNLAERLIAAVAGPIPPTATLSAIRWRLNRVLMLHLAKEDQYLYPQIAASTDKRAAAMASKFAADMGGLAAQYLAYVSKWTPDGIAHEWDAFAVDTRKVMGALRQRILREERDLYPLIEQTAPGQSISA